MVVIHRIYEFVSLVYAMFAIDSQKFTNLLAWFMLCLLKIHLS